MLGFIFGVIFLTAAVVYSVLRQVYKKKVQTDITRLTQNSEQFILPCRVQIFRDSSEDTTEIRQWQFAFALNNGEKQIINDGCAIELSTTLKENALVGYGRSDYGGLSRHPTLDSPFKFKAVEGGFVKLISRPEWNYVGGNGQWKSNLRLDKETLYTDTKVE